MLEGMLVSECGLHFEKCFAEFFVAHDPAQVHNYQSEMVKVHLPLLFCLSTEVWLTRLCLGASLKRFSGRLKSAN